MLLLLVAAAAMQKIANSDITAILLLEHDDALGLISCRSDSTMYITYSKIEEQFRILYSTYVLPVDSRVVSSLLLRLVPVLCQRSSEIRVDLSSGTRTATYCSAHTIQDSKLGTTGSIDYDSS